MDQQLFEFMRDRFEAQEKVAEKHAEEHREAITGIHNRLDVLGNRLTVVEAAVDKPNKKVGLIGGTVAAIVASAAEFLRYFQAKP